MRERLLAAPLVALAAAVCLAFGGLALAATIQGDKNKNTLTGTDGPDEISGGGGDDTIAGLAGRDLLDGGGDSDAIDGGPDDDTIYGANCQTGQLGRYCDNPGRDVIKGAAGNDDLRANKCVTS